MIKNFIFLSILMFSNNSLGANFIGDCAQFQNEVEIANTLLLLFQETVADPQPNVKQANGVLLWWKVSTGSTAEEPEMDYRLIFDATEFPYLSLANSMSDLSADMLAYGVAWKSELISINSVNSGNRPIVRFNVAYRDKIGMEGFFDGVLDGQPQFDSLSIIGCGPNFLTKQK